MSHTSEHDSSVHIERDAQAAPSSPGISHRFCEMVTWSWQTNLTFITFSPGLGRILLYDDTFAEIISIDQWLQYIHKDDRDELQKCCEATSGGIIDFFDCVFRMVRGDKGWCWVLCNGKVTDTKADGSRHVSGICIDVSRLRVHPKFQQQVTGVGDTHYHTLLENSPDVMVRLDRELFPLYANPAISRYLGGRPREELKGTDTAESLKLSPEHIMFMQRNVLRVFDEGISVREMTSIVSAGEHFTGEYAFWPEFGADGSVVSVMTQFRDMTKHIHIQKQAQLNEQRLSALYQLTQMDNASEYEVLDFVLHSMIDLTNSTSSFFFIPDDKLDGRGRMHWSREHDQRVLHTDRLSQNLLNALTGKDGTLQFRSIKNGDGATPIFTAANNTIKVVRFIVAPAMENDRVACLAGVRNKATEYDESDLQQIETFISGAWLIIGRLRYMHALRQAKEAAEAANKAKAQFLSHINHELRTPLTSILGYAETMLELGPDEKITRDRCLEIILRHAKQMHHLVSDLLALSRLESSDIPLAMEPLPLRPLAEKTMDSMQAQLRDKGLDLTIAISPALHVSADAHFLAQVFRNLLENAIRYADKGTTIGISACQEQNVIVVTISDQGAYISTDDLEKIFERFYRGKQQNSEHKTTGIGLSICKHVVELHGGRIWAENTPSGVSVRFSLTAANSET